MTTSSPITSVSSNLLPTVRNLQEARSICHEFASVLTVGPELSEVADFEHPDHKIVTFDDITMSFGRYRAPTFEQVKHIVEWGAGRNNLLVHCHAGMSRSTSSAWGIAIANGFDPQDAYDLLYQNHPVEQYRNVRIAVDHQTVTAKRAFIPNELVLTHLEQLFGLRGGNLCRIAATRNKYLG